MKQFEKLALTGGLAAAAGAGIGIAYTETAVDRVRTDPPVAVVSPEEWVKKARQTLPDDPSEARRKAHLEQAVRSMRRAADNLSSAGYIVLDGAQVLAAPEDFRIEADPAMIAGPGQGSERSPGDTGGGQKPEGEESDSPVQ